MPWHLPLPQEAPPPVSSNAGRAMLPTQASQHRTASVLTSQEPPSAKPAKSASKNADGPTPEPPAVSPPAARNLARRRSMMAKEDAEASTASGHGGLPPKAHAPGEMLEEAIAVAKLELMKLEVVKEMLLELRAESVPPRYIPKLAREAEAKREALADSIRRVSDVESQHEHLSHFCAQARGSLDLLEAADAFDYLRQRRRLRGEYAQLGILSMQSLRAETSVRKCKDRGVMIEAMQTYLETILPNLEKAARERVEATATLHLTLPADLIDDQLQLALIDDLEDHMSIGVSDLLTPSRTFSHLLAPSRTFSPLLTPSRPFSHLLTPSLRR